MMLASTALDILAVTGILTALSTSGIGLLFAKTSEWWQWRRGSATHTIELQLASNPNVGRWKVLYVRDGADKITPGLSERERWFSRFKNEIKAFDEAPGNATEKRVTLHFYRPLGFQFKCFVEVENEAAADAVRRLLEASGCKGIDKGAERQEEGQTLIRVWFFHPNSGDAGSGSRYRIVEAPDNAKNNFFYPV
jgi:hypothetical protein